MLLLSDQGNEVRERDREAAEVGKEVEEGRKRVAGVVSRLMQQSRAGDEGKVGNGMDVDIGNIENGTDDNQGNRGQAGEEDEEDEDEDEDEGFEQVA